MEIIEKNIIDYTVGPKYTGQKYFQILAKSPLYLENLNFFKFFSISVLCKG